MTTTRPYFAAALIATALCGCGAAEPPPADPNADLVVANDHREPAWDGADRWQLREALRIGTIEGDTNYQFGGISAIDVGPTGEIFVLDGQARAILVYDAEGNFERRIGEAGEGPRSIPRNSLAVLAGQDGVISVPDPIGRRIVRFASTGEPAQPIPIIIPEVAFTNFWMQDSRGRALAHFQGLDSPDGTTSTPDGALLLRFEPEGVDTLAVLPPPPAPPGITRFLSPVPIWTITSDDHVIRGHSTAYRFEVVAPDGEVLRVITNDREPVRLTSAQREELVEEQVQTLQRIARRGLPATYVDSLIDSIEIYPEAPLIGWLATMPDGTLWAYRLSSIQLLEPLPEVAEWDVFDGMGRLLGTVEFPPRFAPMAWRDEAIYGVWRDDLDVEYVVKLDVIRPELPEPP